MISYILTTTICWGLFYLLYKLFLSRETFFKLNRIAILGGLGIGAIIPLLANFFSIEEAAIPVVYLPIYDIQTTSDWITQSIETNSQTFFSWSLLLLSIYAIGLSFSALLFFKGILKIYQFKRSANITKQSNYTLVQTKEMHSPFSFGQSIFISTQVDLNSNDLEKIIAHEQAHVVQGHTWDVLFVEVLKIIFWFNPLVYLYQYELKNIHEYLADGAVLKNTPVQQYGKLLLEQSIPGLEVAFANHFIYSQLKNRIYMMTKKRSSKYTYQKYLLVLPMTALLICSIAAQSACSPAGSETIAEQSPESEAYAQTLELKSNGLLEGREQEAILLTQEAERAAFFAEKALEEAKKKEQENKKQHGDAEKMPTFPGCTEGDEAARQTCSTQNLMQFIGKNLKYPKAAKDNKTEGMAVISFVVDTDGSIINAKIVKDVKDGCGAEALRVVNSMNDMPQKWTPGQENGKNVKVEMKLPFRFKLN